MTEAISPMMDDWPFPLFKLEESDAVIWANQAAQEWLGKSLRQIRSKIIWEILETDPDTKTTAFPTSDGVALSFWFAGPEPRETKMGGHIVTGMGRMIAHELKNPLAGIKGAAQLLRDDVDSEEGLALIDLIGSEIDRIRRLADRMEKLGDVDPSVAEQVNIHEILRQARRVIQSANPKIIFDERYDPSLPHVSGDPDTLMQALLNLIKNAAESAGETGEIRLETTLRHDETRRARAWISARIKSCGSA